MHNLLCLAVEHQAWRDRASAIRFSVSAGEPDQPENGHTQARAVELSKSQIWHAVNTDFVIGGVDRSNSARCPTTHTDIGDVHDGVGNEIEVYAKAVSVHSEQSRLVW